MKTDALLFPFATPEHVAQLQEQLNRLESKLDKVTPEILKSFTYSSEEVCKILDVAPKTLQQYRDSNKIEFSQVGQKIWYTPQSIQDFLMRNRIKAKALNK